MKCSIMLHFIWVFTVCKSTPLGVSLIQRVNVLFCEIIYNRNIAQLLSWTREFCEHFSCASGESCH